MVGEEDGGNVGLMSTQPSWSILSWTSGVSTRTGLPMSKRDIGPLCLLVLLRALRLSMRFRKFLAPRNLSLAARRSLGLNATPVTAGDLASSSGGFLHGLVVASIGATTASTGVTTCGDFIANTGLSPIWLVVSSLSVSTLSWLLLERSFSFPFDWGTSSRSLRDHRRLLRWYRHLSLRAHWSSSSESSTCKRETTMGVTLIMYQE